MDGGYNLTPRSSVPTLDDFRSIRCGYEVPPKVKNIVEDRQVLLIGASFFSSFESPNFDKLDRPQVLITISSLSACVMKSSLRVLWRTQRNRTFLQLFLLLLHQKKRKTTELRVDSVWAIRYLLIEIWVRLPSGDPVCMILLRSCLYDPLTLWDAHGLF